MIRKVRREFEAVKDKKHHVFDDFDPIIRRCLKFYAHLFPNHRINKDGSRVVYHFGIEGLTAVSLEKEHGSREYVPRHYAKLAIAAIEELLVYIESSPGSELTGQSGEDAGGTDDASNQ
jgi:hypothetical protein